MKKSIFILVVALFMTHAYESHSVLVTMTRFCTVPGEELIDSIPPSPPILSIANIGRGSGSITLDNGSTPWVEDISNGEISFNVLDAEDNRTPSEKLGYMFHLLNGTTPENLKVPEGYYYSHDSRIWIFWDDGENWTQDSFSFTLYVTSMDRAGNVSDASNVVQVEHDGRKGQDEKYIRRKKWLETLFDKERQDTDTSRVWNESER
ncbi:MAG: hypothetical protein JW814_12720 [Candidatus Krumholzibacteriota bacterium]|nr:hypothetical protein [Candidatus Krumholzibacteriota bacterium]